MGVYSRNNLPKTIKDGTCVVNLDEYISIGTHSIALCVNGSTGLVLNKFQKKSKNLLATKIS